MRSIVPTLLALALLGVAAFGLWAAWGELGAPTRAVRRPEPAATDLDLAPQRPAYQAAAEPEPGAGTRWPELNRRGIEALEAGLHGEAAVLFEECVRGDPAEPIYARNLAEALARQATALEEAGGEQARAQALALLERAVELAPDRANLARLLERWRAEAEAEEGFFVQRTEHFELTYDLDRPEVRRDVDALGRLLEEAYLDFGERFALWPVENGRAAIRVVLYTRDEFDAVTGIGEWAGGVYDGTIRVPVLDLSREMARLRRVLRHELLHAYVQEAGGREVPGWLNEGLAQWVEEEGAARAQALASARAKLTGAKLFALEELAGSLAGWTDTGAIERAYAEALALVAHVAQTYGDEVLYAMVKGCREGADPTDTFARRVHLPLGTVLADLAAELGSPR